MRAGERLARLEALLRRPRMLDPEQMAWQRLLLALRGTLTRDGGDYIGAIRGLHWRIQHGRLTEQDRAALSALRRDDLELVGATVAGVVQVVHDVLTDF